MEKIKKTDEEWKAELSDEEFRVARQAGTERAFTGRYWNTKTAGLYRCVCCGLPLFDASTKFDSGTGWPSFYDVVDSANVEEKDDLAYGMRRTEVHCARCDGHLGHLFEDGPQPTGLRYCINSVSVKLEPSDES